MIKNKYIDRIKQLDNHPLPQYKYIVDDNDNIIDGVTIMRTETLNDDMKNIGYENFNMNENKMKDAIQDKMIYLNTDSIALINDVYKRDFELFNYVTIT